jgi:hypothetical protein
MPLPSGPPRAGLIISARGKPALAITNGGLLINLIEKLPHARIVDDFEALLPFNSTAQS